MPKRTNLFQQLVHLIEHQLVGPAATVTESREFTDQATGEPREVDVVIETKVGAHPFVIGIECVDRKRPMDVTWVEGIHAKHQHLRGINKTILVSRSGFTRPALDKAKQYKIDALTLREAKEADWVKYTGRLAGLKAMTVESPAVLCKEVRLQVMPPSPPPYPPPPRFGKEREALVYDQAGNVVGNIKEIVESVLQTDPNYQGTRREAGGSQ
jgi:hypothetical protein